MRGVSSPMRVTQEGPDGLSRYCPVRVICLEIQLCFLTGALLWQVKLRKRCLKRYISREVYTLLRNQNRQINSIPITA